MSLLETLYLYLFHNRVSQSLTSIDAMSDRLVRGRGQRQIQRECLSFPRAFLSGAILVTAI